MRTPPRLAALALILAGCAKAPSTSPRILPLRTLRLYETGIGYFERAGTASDATSLPIPSGHLDDALESLVILDQGGKSLVHGVEFGSQMSRGMARAMAGLPSEADAVSYRDLLLSLKGAHVEVTMESSERVAGRLADVREPEPATQADKAPSKGDERTIVVITDASEIRVLRAKDVRSVRPTDAAFAPRIGSALDALSSRGAERERMLHVLAHARGPITLAYIAETPVWRTTYRLVLADGGRGGILQGWALVHNDTDEDWSGVRVNLVNGRPDSFLFPIAAPRYARRELIAPETELSTVPQLLGTSADAMWGDHVGDAVGVGGLGLSGSGEGGGGAGEGVGFGRLGGVGHPSVAVGSSSLLEVGNLASVAQAAGIESGALFTYSLAEPLALHAHASALVPFVRESIDVETITWIGVDEAPRSGARLTNSTPQTLPAGPIAIFEAGGFAGESGLERLKPHEQRFLRFGADLDVELTKKKTDAIEEPKRVTFADDRLEEHFLRKSTSVYALVNRSGRPRSVYVALALDSNAKVEGADRMDFDSGAARPIAVFALAGGKRVERTLHAEEGLARTTPIAEVRAQRLTELAAVPSLPPADRAALGDAATRQKELEQTRAAYEKVRRDAAEVAKDLERLREHLRALGGGDKGAANAFTTRLLALEDRVTALRKQNEALEEETRTRTDAVHAALAKLRP